MDEIRINPHFQDLTLLWIQNIEYTIVSIILFYAYIKNKNKTALPLGLASLAGVIGYSIAGFAHQFYPDNYIIQALASNIVAQIAFYAGYVFLILALIRIKMPRLSQLIVVPIFLYGMLALTPYVVNFSPFEVLADGSIDFKHTFIDDFSQFIFGVILMYGFTKIFFTTYKTIQDKIPALFFGLGFISVLLLPAITASTSGTIAYYLQIGVIFGGMCHIIGLLLSARKNT
ncbi:hypothetical protein GW793_01015 [bacterium]|uniref:Uncharacterized protein n=2 Tax=Katanobacteria TaxID=422282 RepID=A0A2M7X0Z5_UNCKA|nr:hypothetical protein [bacterium]PIP56069.1 MAG: hypothetical protein COX05_05075 [candidate division WWE3 bacterium CG22_combo_CG10-13_8_21_14_all_39_12]PJA39844.1 MAG: hypothetical protein CO179_04235 [candidate division WWE3 bacterium CG_4_9_14_3_um_filter_39_7]